MPMIATYSEYLKKHLHPEALAGSPCPGEHHFVAAYLVPRLFLLKGKVPDYINPDGTKGIIGDVTYYEDGDHQFGIEVKLGTVRLTKGEFNAWIVLDDVDKWPHIYVGVGHTGITVCPWSEFRASYIRAVQAKTKGWQPEILEAGYGPMKNVDVLAGYVPKQRHFAYREDAADADAGEKLLMQALKVELGI